MAMNEKKVILEWEHNKLQCRLWSDGTVEATFDKKNWVDLPIGNIVETKMIQLADKFTRAEDFTLFSVVNRENEIVSVGWDSDSAREGAEKILNLKWIDLDEMGYKIVKELWCRIPKKVEGN